MVVISISVWREGNSPEEVGIARLPGGGKC